LTVLAGLCIRVVFVLYANFKRVIAIMSLVRDISDFTT
jgi:hypothetical protein